MNASAIIDDFRAKVCREIDIEPEGINRYVVYTPFMFDDGDHYVIILRQEGDEWVLTDEANTFMHLSYTDVDLSQGSRAKIVEQALASCGVENRSGELRVAVPDEAFGDALFSMLQALGRITSTALWTYERVRSTFEEDFRRVIESNVSADRLGFGYTDAEIDPDGIYPISCRINGSPRPCFVFAISSDSQCQDATITCYHYERHKRHFLSVAIFRDQTEISRKPLAQLSDVVGKQFASLGARDRIEDYLRNDVLGTTR